MYIKLNEILWHSLKKYTLHTPEECLNCNDIENIILDLLLEIEKLEDAIEEKL